MNSFPALSHLIDQVLGEVVFWCKIAEKILLLMSSVDSLPHQ